MFDLIKRLLGRTDCKGCVYRRCWGLYCGKKGGVLPHSAWQKFGCWHYAEDEEIEDMREALDKAKRILHYAIVVGILKGDDAYEALDFVNAALARTAHPSYEMVDKAHKVYKTALDALSLPEKPLPATPLFDGDKYLEKLKLRDKFASTANAIKSNAFILGSGEAIVNECREYYATDRVATLEWINELYFNNLCESYILAGLLQILAAITQKEDEKTMLPIVLISLRSGQCDEEEAAIAVLEKWRTYSCEDALIMSKDKLHSDWIREYAESVLTELEHEHSKKESKE